jgi:chromosome segregation ATPase
VTATETENAETAALSAKLAGARDTIRAQDKELNELRDRVVKLEDKSVVERLRADNDVLAANLRTANETVDFLNGGLAKAQRDLDHAGPAIELAAALKAAVAG